jgi:hypothetical protein
MMEEISIVDMGFALWGGVATALYFSTKRELDRCKYMTVNLLTDLYDGNVELIKTPDGKGLKIKEIKE